MSIIGSNVLAGASGGAADTGYQIQRSLRFNSSDSAYLSRTPSSAGNRKTWTWSGWVKRSVLGEQYILNTRKLSNNDGETVTNIRITSTDQLEVTGRNFEWYLTSTGVYRDVSAWYHIVVAVDTTNSTGDERVKAWVNGEEVTGTRVNPTLDKLTAINSTQLHQISGQAHSNAYLIDGYLADVHFIDGQALDPTDFGEYDDNNVWQPKAYSGTYGTNGFHLDFSDNSTAAALGTDTSGNSNTWTVNNISVTAGAGNDSLVDVPTNGTETDTGVGGEVRGNYCTLNSLINGGLTLSNGNLDFTSSVNNRDTCIATHGVSNGKWYWEYAVSGLDYSTAIGIEPAGYYPAADERTGRDSLGYAWHLDRQEKWHNGSSSSYGASVSSNAVIGVALDLDGGSLTFYLNGSTQGAAYTGISGTYLPSVCDCANTSQGGSSGKGAGSMNFGQRPFAYTAPSGFKALCTANLDAPLVTKPSEYMDVALYTGNGSTQTISGLEFSPDLVWIKPRSATGSHQLADKVRGDNKLIYTNLTLAEEDLANTISLDSTGFTVGTSNNLGVLNRTYVAWTWDAGANSSKTYAVTVVSDGGNKYRFDGYGTSAVTLDLEEGSTYTFDQSDSSNAGHPLRFSTTSDGTHGGGSEYTTGVTTVGTPGSAGASTTIVVASGAPTLYYYCSVHSGMGGQANTNSTAGASNFDGSIQATVRANPSAGFSIVSYTGTGSADTVGHGLNAQPRLTIIKRTTTTTDWVVYTDIVDGSWDYLLLNTTDAKANTSVFSAGSSTFDFSGSSVVANISGGAAIAYCFAPVDGYSSFGNFFPNGTTDSSFVYLGFRPRYVLIKRTDATGKWIIYDSARDTYNLAENRLTADSSDAENTTNAGLDLLSNGFKVRTSVFSSGQTWIYAAFAESPFQYARAR